MKRLLKNIWLILMALPVVGLSSCIYESFADEETPLEATPANDEMWVRIKVGSLNTYANESNPDAGVPIYSLRVVILDENGKVEFNQKQRFETPVTSYYFNALVKAGKKTFYFIANADMLTLYTDGLATTTTEEEFFRPFMLGTTGFEDAANILYFENTYFDTPGNPLPLSSKYEVITTPGIQDDLSFWLVRAATKYTVHFENSRIEKVYLNDLYISSLMSQMYLMPHVGSSQQTIAGKYWIDWLREVSDRSHLDDANQGDANFNDRYGWLTDYSVPGDAEPFNLYLVQNANIEIPGLQTSAGQAKPDPGTLDLGPFYSTEGKNLLPNGGGKQQYTVTIKVTDNKVTDKKEEGNGEGNEESTIFSEYRVLPNLSALFRNTHVIINITLDESYMHVYGEIWDWEENTIYGNVTEEK